MLTQAEALTLVSLATIRAELRIPDDSHDELLSGQIHDAANYVSETTGLGLDDLAPLRAAIVAAVRDMYNGVQQIGPNAAAYGWLSPFRSYAPE